MAQTLIVKPQHVNTAQVFIDGKSILLNNNLTQEQLLAIWQRAEFRSFIDITYTNIADSFPESYVIDPNLFHAYDSGEVSHNSSKADYPANTLGKHLNETRGKIDSFDNSFIRATTRPSVLFDFANGRFIDPRILSTRTTIGTYVDRNGIIRVAPSRKIRYTYHPVTKESLGVIQETRKTNLITYSNNLTNGIWSKDRCNIVISSEISPDATLAAKLVEDTTANNNHIIRRTDITVSANVKYTASVFLKAAERSFATIQMSNLSLYGGNNPVVLVDLGMGSIVSFSNCSKNPTIEAWGNGWYRVSLTQVASASGNSGINVQLTQNANTTYTGDGVSGLYLFGFQFEEGNFASSYIPTNDQPVLRETDQIALDGALFAEYFPNLSEGTMLCTAYKGYANGGYPSYWTFIGPTTTGQNSIRLTNLLVDSDMTNAIYTDGVSQSPAGFSITAGNLFTNIMTWKSGDAKVYNNSSLSADMIPNIPKNLNAFRIEDVNGIIRQIAFWPKRLDNSVIQLMAKNSTLVGKNPTQMPTVGDLGACAFLRPETLLRAKSRQEFSVDGTGASVTRNIRRDYDFTFEIVDSSGVTLTAQPASSCTAGTDNALTFTAPLGKTLTYAITPVYEN